MNKAICHKNAMRHLTYVKYFSVSQTFLEVVLEIQLVDEKIPRPTLVCILPTTTELTCWIIINNKNNYSS